MCVLEVVFILLPLPDPESNNHIPVVVKKKEVAVPHWQIQLISNVIVKRYPPFASITPSWGNEQVTPPLPTSAVAFDVEICKR